jgi:CheY-specific phosphatase CheX
VNASDDLYAPFVEAVTAALREMAAVESGPRAGDGGAPADVSAVLPVTTAAGAGFVALHFSEATATELARRTLARAEAGDGDPALLRDCLGEVVNVVAGQAKALLVGTPYHFALATPRVESGGATCDDGALVVAFESEAGAFTLHARLPV